MSAAFDTAPPNTHAGGDDDALRTKGSVPMNEPISSNMDDTTVDMVAYARDVPLWKRIHQHSLTQMMLISVQAFCGPAMSDAIAGTSSLTLLDRCLDQVVQD
jgi:hypothetical protein